MPRRRLVAFLMTMALATLCCGDLLVSRARGCGPHLCCAKGVSNMPSMRAPHGFDRCPDGTSNTPEMSPVIFTATTTMLVALLAVPAPPAPPARPHDGAFLRIDRPPRV